MNTDLILVCQEFYRLVTSRSFFCTRILSITSSCFFVSNANVFHGEMLKRISKKKALSSG